MRILDVGFAHGEQITVGRVVRAHGIRGELKVYPLSGRPGDFYAYRRLTFVGSGQTMNCEVEESRPAGNLVLLRLAGYGNRNLAEGLRGFEVRIARELLPGLAAGDFYWHELEGLPVIADDGRELGLVASLLGTPAHDILVVVGAGGEYLIPVVPEFVAGLAADGGGLLVTPPPGLLEINAGGAECYGR